MTNDEIFPIYAALWDRLPVDDLYIHYEGPDQYGSAGAFQHDGQGGYKKPEIAIIRSHYVSRDRPTLERSNGGPVDLASEMCTLAHEYGHFLSYEGATERTTWLAYHAAVLHRDAIWNDLPDGTSAVDVREAFHAGMTDDERGLIVAEETLAWSLGRQFVPEGLLADYDRRCHLGIHFHRYRLGIDSLWPGDESGWT